MGRLATWTALVWLGMGWLGPATDGAWAATPVHGLSDDLAFTDARPGQRALAFATARQAGARVVRITLDWSLVAPAGQVKPAGFDAPNPSDPAYRWGYIEDAVRDAARKRLGVVLVVVRAPAWAEGVARPSGAPAGSWRPDPGELGAFVRAAARRFSGFYPDPKDEGDGLTEPGASLPRVRFWQIWDQPNGGASLRPVGGLVEHYRRMLAASRRELRRVARDNALVAGATAASGPIGALAFWRRLLDGGPRFEVAAHSPGARRAAGAGPRAAVLGLTQLPGLRRLLDRAGRRSAVWMTSVGWDTPPHNRRGVSPDRQAQFLTEALYVADEAGAALVDWNGLQDRASYLPGFASIASGLFFNFENDLTRDPPKPALTAFRFPFMVRASSRGPGAWGIAPRPQAAVLIERRGHAGWLRVGVVKASGSGEFRVRERVGRGVYRARQGRAASLSWRR
jgi:hypothetical protein